MATPRNLSSTQTTMKFLGYDRYDAATNMAIDEAMALKSAETGESFIRFYDFVRPSIILAVNDDPKCLIRDNLEGVDVTRRKSGGRPIFVSSNILSYSLSIPISPKINETPPPLRDVHQRFGRLTADAIAKIAGIDSSELELPRTSSIRYNGNPIAGHGQYVSGGFLLYHGVIVVAPWDAVQLRRIIKLNNSDQRQIERLPCVLDLLDEPVNVDTLKKRLVDEITTALSGGNFSIANRESHEIRAVAHQLKLNVYSNMDDWVFKKDAQRTHDVPFCILWEESNGAIAESGAER